MRTRMVHRIVTSLAIAATVAVGFAVPAAAAPGVCSNGWACRFPYNDYDLGNLYQQNNQYSDADFAIADNWADSVISQGNSCRTSWYKDANYGGASFYLHRVVDGYNYQDPNLSNGAGQGPYSGSNFSNNLTSLKFVDCV
ncbi:hypothetical protein [Actinotalea subterranea]|uniref:hypothetical protein n=1 Tax=Actinotalea subterranea TaxID=2607497 RepID=UPI0011EF34CE|nr:hypothetical protein [Actinotalea subterranea]